MEDPRSNVYQQTMEMQVKVVIQLPEMMRMATMNLIICLLEEEVAPFRAPKTTVKHPWAGVLAVQNHYQKNPIGAKDLNHGPSLKVVNYSVFLLEEVTLMATCRQQVPNFLKVPRAPNQKAANFQVYQMIILQFKYQRLASKQPSPKETRQERRAKVVSGWKVVAVWVRMFLLAVLAQMLLVAILEDPMLMGRLVDLNSLAADWDHKVVVLLGLRVVVL